ncbi:sugar transporter [Salipaludibacillus neizhouensis]|uniref:Sugar transporter n=1 Tax=Salipaludibacillus neizhouensis TaxID=885475 RepID=A0A3A9K271_9BACI|nr:extracellular solute-binding protein [Salipaludibacillus neizhouensis]RKL66827.1 sugar transporter [Salipaludibacillus neizhouensis]
MKKLGYITMLSLFTFLGACSDNSENSSSDGNGDSNTNSGNEDATVNEENEGEETVVGGESAEVELSFWLFGATGYPELAKEYMEENPEISITFQEIEMEDHHNNLFTALSAGSGAPDMAAVEVSEMGRYQDAQDRFHNLYDLGAKEIKGDYLEWVWEIGENVDGDFLFGIPTDIGPTVMFYRSDVFEEAGLPSEPEDVEALIQTWDDFEEAAATILEETGVPMVDNPELMFNALRDQQPQQYFDENDELIIESTSDTKESFMKNADFIEKGYVGSMELWSPEWGAGMAEGNYATLLAPAWMQGQIKDNAPDATEWRIATLPEGAGNWGGSWITIPAESEHAEEAYDFLTWLLSPEGQLKAFENMGLFPSAPEVYEMEEFVNYTDDYFGGQHTAEIFAEAALQVEHVYKGEHYPAVNQEIQDGLYNVQEGVDKEEEWADILERVDQRISR